METTSLLLTTPVLTDYSQSTNQCEYEREILNEMLNFTNQDNQPMLDWFRQFGISIRIIIFNVHAYRMGLRFGFEDINFDEYGWLKKPKFLDIQELHFGIAQKERFGTYSTITLGRGLNGIWTFGLSAAFGIAGSSSGICVYGKIFPSKDQAQRYAADHLKRMMLPKVGNSDTTNFNQKVILATLKDLERLEVNTVQLALF